MKDHDEGGWLSYIFFRGFSAKFSATEAIFTLSRAEIYYYADTLLLVINHAMARLIAGVTSCAKRT